MIQLKRGKTANWLKQKTPLEDGQPGYDRDRHKLKIGDGKSSWSELPDASGLSAEEILEEESKAKERVNNKFNLGLIPSFLAGSLKKEDRPVFTYGTESPDKDTVGQVYLQYYDTDPEVDYVVESGVNGIWTYQKWHSGKAMCWGTLQLITSVNESFENIALYHNNEAMSAVAYPFSFTDVPTETASLHNSGNVAWLASKTNNKKNKSATYNIISMDKSESGVTYNIALNVEGCWK